MDKIKQNIDLQEAIQRYNIEKSVVGTLAYNIEQNLQKGMSPDEAIEDVLQKSKSMPIGTIHNGYKKIAEGKWRKVSESHGYTKEEHGEKFKEANKVALDKKGEEGSKKIADAHYLNYEKLDSKDYSDEEVMGGEKKEEYKKGDKFEHDGETIYVGLNTSGGQNTITYKAPSISDKTYWDLNKLKEDIKQSKTQKSQLESTLSKSEQTETQKAKVKKVMDEWKAGKLKSSSGEKVTDQKQALAIAMSEVGIEIKKSEGSNIEKSGEGSKGGKVIGHTKSGKPIYESTEVEHDHGIKVGHEVQHEGRTKKVTDVRGNILYFGNNDYAHVSKVYKKDGSSYV